MHLSDFDFDLPDRLIAQTPAPVRDGSKMMVVWRDTGKREHRIFRDLPDILDSDSFLVVNNTKVFPARLRASRPGKREEIEILLLKELRPLDWLALVKPARKALPGQEFIIGGRTAKVLEARESGSRVFRFESGGDLNQLFEKIGEPPSLLIYTDEEDRISLKTKCAIRRFMRATAVPWQPQLPDSTSPRRSSVVLGNEAYSFARCFCMWGTEHSSRCDAKRSTII